MQNLKFTVNGVQKKSLYFSVSHVKCMHEMKSTLMSKLLIEKELEDYRNGLKMKLKIQ